MESKVFFYVSFMLGLVNIAVADSGLRRVIDWFDDEHPNAVCQRTLDDKKAYWDVNQIGACTNQIQCGIEGTYYRFQVTEKPKETSECGFGKSEYYGCYEGRCTLLNPETLLPPRSNERKIMTKVG